MSYRNGAQPTGGPVDGANGRLTQDALRQALSTMSAGGSLTPGGLELAQRAGLANPGRIADLGRMMGLDAGPRALPQHIFFLLGDDECALPAGTTQGVERITDVTHVPNTAPWVLGVVQVWGAIVSVVDLRRFVGLPPLALTGRSRLLVVTQREMTIGFVVDAVTEMRPLGDVAAGPVDAHTPAWAKLYAQGRIQLEGHAATLLDPDRLLFGEKIQQYHADAG